MSAQDTKKAAFLSTYATLSDLQTNGDDDEVAAANWFVNIYGGKFLSISDVTATDLSQYDCIWIAVDRVGINIQGMSSIIAPVKDKLTTYYKEGGNLLLTTHATSVVVDLGRTTRLPNFYLSHNGDGVLSDVWSFQANIGVAGGDYDHSEHPIYKNMTDTLIFSYPTIPLIGPGFREAHFTMWFFDQYGLDVNSFQTENDAIVLGTWGQAFNTSEFTTGAIIEFLPTEQYFGRSIVIGTGAYEWNQNTNANKYQSQIERLTENSIDYLINSTSTKTESVNAETNIKLVIKNNKLCILQDNYTNIENINIYTVGGVLTGKYNYKQLITGIDLAYLSSGIYISSLYDKQGNLIDKIKLVK